MYYIWVSAGYINNISGGIAVIRRCQCPSTSAFLKPRKEKKENKMKKHAKITYDMYIYENEKTNKYTREKYEHAEQNIN